MKTSMFILAFVLGLSFLTSDIWACPQVDQLIPLKNEVVIDTCHCPSNEPIIIKVHRGKEFDIVLHMWYWKFKESYGLTYRTSWYRGYTTIFRFRVDSWYIGNELLLTFTRGDGLVVKYLIVNIEAN